MIKRIAQKAFHLLIPKKDKTGVAYWQKRAKTFGERSVLNVNHSEEEMEEVTRMQKDTLFPLFKEQLRGNETLVLDLGCGPGRFTRDLGDLIRGRAVGVDPIQYLLKLAPQHDNVTYHVMKKGLIPLENDSVDVVWTCLVLGGITEDKILLNTIDEIERVLKSEGLLFLVENTSNQEDCAHWKYRTVQEYRELFHFVQLTPLSSYTDMEEEITIMAGRSRV